MVSAGLVVLGGIAVRQRRWRVGGDIMVAIAAVPTVVFFWMVFPLLMTLPVIVAASVDMAEARSLGRQGRPA
jgi:hypothetical protein